MSPLATDELQPPEGEFLSVMTVFLSFKYNLQSVWKSSKMTDLIPA